MIILANIIAMKDIIPVYQILLVSLVIHHVKLVQVLNLINV